MTQPALDGRPYGRPTHGPTHDETRTHRGNRVFHSFHSSVRVDGAVRGRLSCLVGTISGVQVCHQRSAPGPAAPAYRGREVLAPPQPIFGRQHGMDLGLGCSGRQTGATLAAARREDRAAGTGPHAQTETVGLRAAAVVRLEGALAHSGAPGIFVVSGRRVVGRRLAVTVRPRVARHARVHRFTITKARSLPIGGRRQQPSTTRPGHGTRGYAIRSNQLHEARERPRPGHTMHSLWTTT